MAGRQRRGIIKSTPLSCASRNAFHRHKDFRKHTHENSSPFQQEATFSVQYFVNSYKLLGVIPCRIHIPFGLVLSKHFAFLIIYNFVFVIYFEIVNFKRYIVLERHCKKLIHHHERAHTIFISKLVLCPDYGLKAPETASRLKLSRSESGLYLEGRRLGKPL